MHTLSRLLVANEGEPREWGDEESDAFYCNEQKGTTSPTGEALLLVANEVSGTMSVVSLAMDTAEETVVPQVEVEVEIEAEVEVEMEAEVEVETAAIYTVQSGDSLWAIASKLLGSGSRWGEIYNMNTATISDPALIQIGQILNIPG